MKERRSSLDYLSRYSLYPNGLLTHMQEVLVNNGNGFILPDVYTDPFYSYYQEQQSWRTPSYDPLGIAKYKSG